MSAISGSRRDSRSRSGPSGDFFFLAFYRDEASHKVNLKQMQQTLPAVGVCWFVQNTYEPRDTKQASILHLERRNISEHPRATLSGSNLTLSECRGAFSPWVHTGVSKMCSL